MGNTEEEDKVGAALHCGGCSDGGGRSLLFITASNSINITIHRKYTYMKAADENYSQY